MVASEGLPGGERWSLRRIIQFSDTWPSTRRVFSSGESRACALRACASPGGAVHSGTSCRPNTSPRSPSSVRSSDCLPSGPKLSGLDYSSDDRAMLLTLANQTAVAIENARLYASVQDELAEREAAESRLLDSLAREGSTARRKFTTASRTTCKSSTACSACRRAGRSIPPRLTSFSTARTASGSWRLSMRSSTSRQIWPTSISAST